MAGGGVDIGSPAPQPQFALPAPMPPLPGLVTLTQLARNTFAETKAVNEKFGDVYDELQLLKQQVTSFASALADSDSVVEAALQRAVGEGSALSIKNKQLSIQVEQGKGRLASANAKIFDMRTKLEHTTKEMEMLQKYAKGPKPRLVALKINPDRRAASFSDSDSETDRKKAKKAAKAAEEAKGEAEKAAKRAAKAAKAAKDVEAKRKERERKREREAEAEAEAEAEGEDDEDEGEGEGEAAQEEREEGAEDIEDSDDDVEVVPAKKAKHAQ
jgi:hypothetical protein